MAFQFSCHFLSYPTSSSQLKKKMFIMNWQMHVLIVLSLWSLVGISPAKGNGNGNIIGHSDNARELQQEKDEDHHHRELQECILIPSGQKHEVIGTWVFDFIGRPGIITAEEIEVLKEILMEFNCQNQNDDSFFAFQYIQAMNMQYDDESMTYQNDTIPFSWMIRMNVSTNVLSQDEPGGIFDTRRLKEIPKEETIEGNNGLRRHLSSCRCVIPSRVDILMTTRELITELHELLPSIDSVSDIVRTEEVECSAGNDQFESFFSMTIYGDETSVTSQGLESVGNVFRSTYNVINLDACDMYFRKIANITVSVADTGIPTTNTNPGIPATENNDANGDNGPGRYLQVALPPAAAPAAASAGGSGSAPPASAAPSDVTTFPTTSPTSRGPNLFTLLFTLSGTCRGCPSDQALFDQVDVPETPVRGLSGSGARDRELDGFDNNGMGQCFCPVDAPLRGPTMDEFLGSLNPNLDVAKETGNVPFIEIGGAIDLDELQAFNCSVDYDTFTRYLSASFTGDPSLLTEEDRRELERIFMDAYNRLNEQFCDVDFKFVIRVRILEVVDTIPTASPSVMPTVSSAPSESGAPSHSLEPSIIPSGTSNNNRRRQELSPVLEISRRELQEEDGEPSDSPTITAAPSTSSHPSSSSSPSESPTEEVTASPFSFSVVFLLEGVCYGCENNAGLFNQVAGGRTRRQLNDESQSTTTNTQIHTDDGVCYCHEDAVNGQVDQQAFFEEVEREIRVLDIQAIDSIVGATEMDEYDQTATGLAATIGSLVPSAVPSEFPSVFPSELPSVFPSELPSNMPSVSPSSNPSVNPSEQPTSAPSLSVVPTSYPSESPTEGPTKCRIVDNVPQTERYFVCTNENNDDVQYSVCIDNEEVEMESCKTANRNLEENGGVQRRAEEATGETYECRVFVSVFDSEGCQRDYEPTKEFEVSGIISGVDRPCVATVTGVDGLTFYVFPECVLKTESPSSSPSNVPSSLPSENPTGAPSISPSMDPTAQPSAAPTAGPSLSTFPTLVPSVPPSLLPSSTPSEGPTDEPSSSPSKEPTTVPSAVPTAGPSLSTFPTLAPSVLPSVLPSLTPSEGPTDEPSSSPSKEPTNVPSAVPTAGPSLSTFPTLAPSVFPSVLPSSTPSEGPTGEPSLSPSKEPSSAPSNEPTGKPSQFPSKSPTQQPSNEPTNDPTVSPKPTPAPTPEPTKSPTAPPTSKPTASPTLPPTSPPTTPPTPGPTPVPTTQPSSSPTTPPTSSPTPLPTAHPTQTPTTSPTTSPTPLPTTEPTPDPTPKPTITPVPTPDPTPGPTSSPTTTPTAEPTPAPTTPEPTSEPTPGPTPAPTQPPTPDPTPAPSPGPTPEPTTSAPTTVCSQAPPLSAAIFTCIDACDEPKNECEISLDNGEISCDNAGPGKGGNSPKQATCDLAVTVHVSGVDVECALYTESFTLVVPSNARNCDLCPPKLVKEIGEPWYYVSGATCKVTGSGPDGSEINA